MANSCFFVFEKNILLSQICQPFLLNALRFVRGTSHGGTVAVVVEAGDAVVVGGTDEGMD